MTEPGGSVPDTPPALPVTRSQLTKLGKRLAGGRPADGDRELYLAVLDAYDRVQVGLVAALTELHWDPDMPPLRIRGRTKTLDTLVQKLRRSPEVQLPYIRDIAGIRIVADLTLVQQSAVAARLVERYGGRIVDRRDEPQAGYRAVHVAMTVDGIPVEVQVRTRLQHLWAELFERTADNWGRQIRYGGAPDRPEVPGGAVDGIAFDERVDVIASLQAMSTDTIARIEQLTTQVGRTADVQLVHEEMERVLLGLVRAWGGTPFTQLRTDTVDEP